MCPKLSRIEQRLGSRTIGGTPLNPTTLPTQKTASNYPENWSVVGLIIVTLKMPDSTFERSTLINAPASRLREWHFREGAFEELSPPWEKATVLESPGAVSDGARAVIEVGIGPLKQRWVAVHEITETGFIDRQESGPFTSWEHRHDFLPVDENSSQLVDSIRYRLPLGWLGALFGGPLVRRKLDRLFTFRHEVTCRALEDESD